MKVILKCLRPRLRFCFLAVPFASVSAVGQDRGGAKGEEAREIAALLESTDAAPSEIESAWSRAHLAFETETRAELTRITRLHHDDRGDWQEALQSWFEVRADDIETINRAAEILDERLPVEVDERSRPTAKGGTDPSSENFGSSAAITLRTLARELAAGDLTPAEFDAARQPLIEGLGDPATSPSGDTEEAVRDFPVSRSNANPPRPVSASATSSEIEIMRSLRAQLAGKTATPISREERAAMVQEHFDLLRTRDLPEIPRSNQPSNTNPTDKP